MEFTEEKAREVIDRYNLSQTTIKVWKSRNSIPDKYADEKYVQIEVVSQADKILLSRLNDLCKSEVLNFTVLSDLARVERVRLLDAIRGKARISKDDIDHVRIEIKRARIFILNTFSDYQSEKKLKVLIDNKIFKHYSILKKGSWSTGIVANIKKGAPIEKFDYEKLKDRYLKASILMNV